MMNKTFVYRGDSACEATNSEFVKEFIFPAMNVNVTGRQAMNTGY